MIRQKGFSLIEVLISLALITTLGLNALEQQEHTKQTITQLILHCKASQFLDQIDELLWIGIEEFPKAPKPYHFIVEKKSKNLSLHLSWFKSLGSLTRTYSLL